MQNWPDLLGKCPSVSCRQKFTLVMYKHVAQVRKLICEPKLEHANLTYFDRKMATPSCRQKFITHMCEHD